MKNIILTAYWADQAAESTLSISKFEWSEIQQGKNSSYHADAVYEGLVFKVRWSFCERNFTIEGDDGADYVNSESIAEIQVS